MSYASVSPSAVLDAGFRSRHANPLVFPRVCSSSRLRTRYHACIINGATNLTPAGALPCGQQSRRDHVCGTSTDPTLAIRGGA